MKLVWIVWVVLALLVSFGAGALVSGGWSPDFTNTAWGNIVGGGIGALLTGVVGVMLRGKIEQELDRKRGGITSQIEQEKIAFAAAAQQELERLRAELSGKGAEEAARRDYQYEARKRLYQRCEPLLFQLQELAENALSRIYSLARSAYQGKLEEGRSWLSGDGYYMLSTVYMLLAPAAVFKILQRQLTTIDMTLDPRIKATYELSKLYCTVFTADFEVAQIATSLSYDPDCKDSLDRRKTSPADSWKQGVTWGKLENALEALVETDKDAESRCKTFGRFQVEWREEAGRARFEPLYEILLEFHPGRRPVLWRLLIAQAHICARIIQVASQEWAAPRGMPRLDLERLNWRATDSQNMCIDTDPVGAAMAYLRMGLPEMNAPRGS